MIRHGARASATEARAWLAQPRAIAVRCCVRCGWAVQCVPVHRSVLVDEMIALAPEALGLDDGTSAGERLAAWLAYARDRFEEERRTRCPPPRP